MTTICWDGHDLASDSIVTQDSCIIGSEDKIWKLDDGGWFAGGGAVDEIWKLFYWINRTGPQPPATTEGHAEALYWRDGRMYYVDTENLVPYPAPAPSAISSHPQIAHIMMLEGLSAEDAVKFLCKHTTTSKEPVTKVHLVD